MCHPPGSEIHTIGCEVSGPPARYSSYDTGIGKQIEKGKATFADCEAYAGAGESGGEPERPAGVFENVINDYLW